MKLPAVVLPQLYADRLSASGKNSGLLDVKFDQAEQLALIDGIREGQEGNRRQGLSAVPGSHYLAHASNVPDSALWFRVDPVLHVMGADAHSHGAAITLKGFRSLIPSGDWINPGRGAYSLAITVTKFDELDITDFCAWRLNQDVDSAEILPLDVVPEELDLLFPLDNVWPRKELSEKCLLLIGAGSIGSAAAEALAAYGLRRLIVVDPDRLYSKNLARHRVGREHIGRYKVNGLADRLRRRDPSIEVNPLALDVIYDADLIRTVLPHVDGVLVTSDGIDSRRTANHLARRAEKSAVFACVLADGAFGEILRIRPPKTGCLLCARAELMEKGAMNPEPRLDRGYGEGTRHLPMTAVGGDLGLVGQLAAKASVATLLDELGYREQQLAGDQAIIGLQPKPDMAAPFNLEHASEVRWYELPPPRPKCPTCGSPQGHGLA